MKIKIKKYLINKNLIILLKKKMDKLKKSFI